MNWYKEGIKAARIAPDRWSEIADGHYRLACAERDAKVKTLEHHGLLLKQQERDLLQEMQATPARPFHVTLISAAEAVLWGVAALFLIHASYSLILNTLPLLTNAGESRELLALVLAVGIAIAFELLFRRLAENLPESSPRRWALFVVLTSVLLLFASAITQSLLRGEHESARAALAMLEGPALEVDGQSPRKADAAFEAIVSAYRSKSRQLGNMVNLLATAGLELAAAMALHECLSRLLPSIVFIIVPLRLRRVRRRIVQCAQQIEECKNWPEFIKEEFTRGATIELSRHHFSHTASEVEETSRMSLSIWILIFVGLFVVTYIFFVARVYAADMMVTLVDLTDSSSGPETGKNLRAVDKIIAQLSPGSRIAILPITDRSFAKDPILEARITTEPGVFGEKAKAAQQELLNLWRARSKSLKADSQSTDVFGALARAALLFETGPRLRPNLIVLSDVRHAAGKFNFEKLSKIDLSLIDKVERDDLVAPLTGVKVWVLGAHANGVSETYWMSLRRFWQTYFKKAGADLKTFSPDRRWNYE